MELTPACVQINSETDFVARNDQFRSLVSVAAQAALRADASSAGRNLSSFLPSPDDYAQEKVPSADE